MATWDDVENEGRRLQDLATALGYHIQGLDVLPVLIDLREMQDRMDALAVAVVEIAGRDTRITQKALAEALGVPASTLRGLRAS